VIFHKRLLPTPGSTLAGLIEGQEGGFPEIARLLPFEGDFVSVVANMRYTPAFVAAVKVYVSAYIDSMIPLMQSADADPFTQQFAPMMRALEPLIDLWFECQRGDFAGSFALDAERGLRVVEILGAADPEACRSVLAQSAQLYADLEPGPDGQRLFSVTEKALVHAGVQADRYETRLDLALAASPTDDPEREEALQLLHSLFGSDALTTFSGLSGDLMLITGGAESEQAFKDLVDVSKKKKKKKLEGGLTPEAFAPLEPGPGLFVTMDLAALAGTVAASLAPLAGDENEELERLKQFPADAGNLVYGARLDGGSLTIELAMPLKLIRSIREMIPDDEAAEVEPETETTGA
jgi:hypothetical protein